MKEASTNWSKQTDLVRLVWDENAWRDYLGQAQDRRVLGRINLLLRDIQRNGNGGIGKPQALKHGFAGYWSRRSTDEHRLVYKIAAHELRIASQRTVARMGWCWTASPTHLLNTFASVRSTEDDE